MPAIEIITSIQAPIELCFDLARSIDLHIQSMAATSEKAIAGITSGLIGMDEEVTWEATHFFVRQHLTSRITAFQRPSYFRDSQVRGAFRRFDHDHFFEFAGGKTRMRDGFDYDSPWGFLGRVADRLFLEDYMRKLVIARAEAVKMAAELQVGKIVP